MSLQNFNTEISFFKKKISIWNLDLLYFLEFILKLKMFLQRREDTLSLLNFWRSTTPTLMSENFSYMDVIAEYLKVWYPIFRPIANEL